MSQIDDLTPWQLVGYVEGAIPFSKPGVENLFHTTLTDSANEASDVFRFLENSVPVRLNGAVVSSIDLRIKRAGSHSGFLALGLSGSCLTLAEVRHHYPTLQLTGTPRGHSMDESTTYSLDRPWGRLSFSFKLHTPSCVASIIFDPHKFDGPSRPDVQR